MDVRVFRSAGHAAVALAEAISEAVRNTPDLVLGLPAGRTPLPVYAELGRLYRAGRVDFSRVRTFNLDELAGISAASPGSFRSVMNAALFDAINLPASQIGFLDGAAADPVAECARYEAAIAAAGGMDLVVLGIGENGHIGFNEPGDALIADTHPATLHEDTRRASAHLFGGDITRVPGRALSMGVGTILRASAIALIATGRSKSRAVAGTIRGPVTTRLPASLLQTHRRVTLYLDEEAASGL